MRTLSNWVEAVVGFVAGALLLVTAVVVFTEVVLRYFLFQSLAWADEAARFLFIWTALLGAALCVKDGSHFAITMLVDRFPSWTRSIVILLTAVGTSLVFGVMVTEGWRLVLMNRSQVTPGVGVPMSIPYLVVPVSGALMLFFTWANVIAGWTHPRTRAPRLEQPMLPRMLD